MMHRTDQTAMMHGTVQTAMMHRTDQTEMMRRTGQTAMMRRTDQYCKNISGRDICEQRVEVIKKVGGRMGGWVDVTQEFKGFKQNEMLIRLQ